jgi:hypothetical protein
MKMHLLVCTLTMLFTQRCCNMIVQTVGLEWHSHGLPISMYLRPHHRLVRGVMASLS